MGLLGRRDVGGDNSQRLQLLFIFIKIAGAIFVESVTFQPGAERQMRRQFALLDLAALGNIDFQGWPRFHPRVNSRPTICAPTRLQPLFVQRFRLAQTHQQEARSLDAGRRQHFQKLARFCR